MPDRPPASGRAARHGHRILPGGDVTSPFWIIRTIRAVKVRITGGQAVVVRVLVRAPAVLGFTEYAQTATYRVPPAR